jgi:hypothetical protein
MCVFAFLLVLVYRCAFAQSISSPTHSPSLRYSHPRRHACHPSACSYSLSISPPLTFSLLLPILHTSTLPLPQIHRLFKRARRRSRTFLARSFDACVTSCARMAWMEWSCTTLLQFGPRSRTRLGWRGLLPGGPYAGADSRWNGISYPHFRIANRG